MNDIGMNEEIIENLRVAARWQAADGVFWVGDLLADAADGIEIYKSLYEELRKENLETIKLIGEAKKEAEIGVIKEFAAKLIAKLDNEALTEFEMYDGYDIDDTKLAIDNLVKEMASTIGGVEKVSGDDSTRR